MAIKYIQKHKDGNWGISNSKTGKAIKNAKTEKEALAIAGTYKNVEGVMILRKGTWKKATGWDMELVNVTKAPKKAAAKKKTAAKKAPAKKAPAKKKTGKSETIVTTTTTTKTSQLSGKKATAKKAPAKKKAAPKKAKQSLVVIDKRNAKKETAAKPVAKKAPAKKAVKKTTTINTTKTTTVSSDVKPKKAKVDRTGGLPGWAGFVIGLSIIVVVIGTAFLIGYYI